jgi:YidC/Oxa1 family membrane protein insertase
VDDNYFMSVALQPGPVKVSYEHFSIPDPSNPKTPRELTAYSLEPRQPGQPIKFFIGPKDFDVLQAMGPDMTRAINFGTFSVIVVPLLRSLKWVNTYVGNYGWSIILLTFFINVILFPLRHKSVVSMRKMQEIQPEVKAIQDRYAKLKATDPAKQKMNTEMMALYRERGVNPASGCVPMLLTMPVLIAFYALLSSAIELRGAPFFGWIHDLSLHDPLYITPVLMGITMVWQQRLTPAAGADPAQQKMMMFMPIIFTFMFLWAPAGVAVYWLMSNLWGIGQQYATNYMIGPPVIKGGGGSAAERRVKRVGAGKTDAASRDSSS